jgi:homoaconitase/3-isopropylmalate dehydratase large subunit
MNIDQNIIIKYCDEGNVKDLKDYLKNKKLNTKLVNNMFINSCTNGKIQIVKWILQNYSDD